MATIAEILVGSVAESSQKAPDLAGSLTQGMELAQHAEKVSQQREQLEAKKIEVKNTKAEEITRDMLRAKHMSPKQLSGYTKFIKNKVKSYAIEDIFPEDAIDLAMSTPDNLARFESIKDDVQNGVMSLEEGVVKLQDQSQFYDITPDMQKDLRKAAEMATKEKGLRERAQMSQQASLGKQMQAQGAAPEVQAGKDTAKAFATWTAGGGAAAREKTREIFNKVINRLGNNEVEFGTLFKNLPWVGNPEKLPMLDKKAKALLDDIRGAISIKEKTGDPNPTQSQIDSIMSRIIDPRLTNKQNIEKLQTELNAMDADTENKMAQFGRLGFSDPTFKPKEKSQAASSSDWKMTLQVKKDAVLALPKAKQDEFINGLSKLKGISTADIRKELGL